MTAPKIINDPLYGFITVRSGLLSDIIAHPYFQRLRFIKQLGVTDYVYPGAVHSRFQHALGAMHLMQRVLEQLRLKGVEIDEKEEEAALAAMLLHDIGHGPFSHALEAELLVDARHESVSYAICQHLNELFNNELEFTLRIFRNAYERQFLNQLVSSQLDIDRMDYLHRDCFFTGVMEGKIGVERIIMLLNVHRNKLVVEEKGIYSIENFLTARRAMYWQVYLHKTCVSAERMLVNIIRRAKLLSQAGEKLPGSDPLLTFLRKDHHIDDLTNRDTLSSYASIDDMDVMGAVKLWRSNSDSILALLCNLLLERRLFEITMSATPIRKDLVEQVRHSIASTYETLNAETPFLFSTGSVTNEAYAAGEKINVLTRSGEVKDLADITDLPNIQPLGKIVKKNYLCWPENLSL